MTPNYCGLDFGTSNSTIGVQRALHCELVLLEKNKPTLRSAIFCDNEAQQWVFGQEGIEAYLDGVPGRLMMAIKTVLGSALMNDETVIFNKLVPYKEILRQFIYYLKNSAEKSIQSDLTQVVLGRPVHFHDHDVRKDNLAQQTLEQIARDVGFKEVLFQYEPIAAALAYETTITRDQLALIVDMGGGTSDFTVIQLRPDCQQAERTKDVLANCGIHIAGTDFDQALSLSSVMPLLGMGSMVKGVSNDMEVPSSFYHDLTTWHTLNSLYKPTMIAHLNSICAIAYDKPLLQRLLNVIKTKSGHHILDVVEKAKQTLSDQEIVQADLSFIDNNLNVAISRDILNKVIEPHLIKLIATVKETLQLAAVAASDISAVFYTGGSTKIPLIRACFNELFPQAEIIQGDAFGSVGLGLTLDALRKFR
jgi:hypothetical chaperone protein